MNSYVRRTRLAAGFVDMGQPSFRADLLSTESWELQPGRQKLRAESLRRIDIMLEDESGLTCCKALERNRFEKF